MRGPDLINSLKGKLAADRGLGDVSDRKFAEISGISISQVQLLKKSESLSAAQVANLMMKFARAEERRWRETIVVPIIEFLHIDPIESRGGVNWRLFDAGASSTSSAFLSELKTKLEASKGIYVFHDSRGRAIYAGKAVKQSLWKEMNLAFNRDRKEVQSIKRVEHKREAKRALLSSIHDGSIKRVNLKLHHIAKYASAYLVPAPLIGKFEALIVRAFANDLLNVRMESFGT